MCTTARIYGKRILILNKDDARNIYKMGFYGKFVGYKKVKDLNIEDFLELSLIEAIYLLERKIIKVIDTGNNEINIEELKKIANKEYENFHVVYEVYKFLRSKGYVVKSGLKFGTTFAVYQHGPGIDHAPFLVHVIPYSNKLDPIEVVRGGRLSHSVKKKFVIATLNPIKNEIEFYTFSWFA